MIENQASNVLYDSVGKLKYFHKNNEYSVALEVDQGIMLLYKSLIPKWHTVYGQRHHAHITVVRNGKEKPRKMDSWGKYQNELVDFKYSPIIHCDERYYWLNAQSYRLEQIRVELGLPKTRYVNCFHITIGNKKEQES